VIAGIPFFVEVFKFLGAEERSFGELLSYEGRYVEKSDNVILNFSLPFAEALTGERIALTIIQRASSIATHTRRFVELTKEYGIKILDTRKTTPGHRGIEKYAVRVGGGYNHRFGQSDVWMVKDNHKKFFGGLEKAINFFRETGSFYNNMVVEIHDLDEFKKVIELDVKHIMLDNFEPEMVKQAIAMRPEGITIEVSGGINMDTIQNYCIQGVDAISMGSLTYDAPHVDISLKYEREI
jgi:nicotinate-nucleotide pyrophosphorylase (carboxylating)